MTLGKLFSLAFGLLLAGVAAAAPGDPKQQFNPADQAVAKKVVLKRSDLPGGFTATLASPAQSKTQPSCKGIKPDNSDLILTGRAVSPDFRGPGGFPLVSAKVSVFRTARQAQTNFRRGQLALQRLLRAPRCITNLLNGPKRAKVVPTSGVLRGLPGLGEQAVGMWIQCVLVQRTKSVPFALDLFAILKRRTVASLSTGFLVTLQGRFAFEKPLLTKMAARMP